MFAFLSAKMADPWILHEDKHLPSIFSQGKNNRKLGYVLPKDRTVDLADDFDIWLRKGSPSECILKQIMDMYTNNINFNPDIKDICIFSYNSRGFQEDNQTVCKDLPKIAGNKFSIICNQENFLLKGNKYKKGTMSPRSPYLF